MCDLYELTAYSGPEYKHFIMIHNSEGTVTVTLAIEGTVIVTVTIEGQLIVTATLRVQLLSLVLVCSPNTFSL